MSLLVFQHHRDETAARLGDALQSHGYHLRTVKLYEAQPLPPDLDDVDGLVAMGGPMNYDQANQHPWLSFEMDLIRMAHEAGKPIVGVCLGAQLIAAALGGQVESMAQPEVGFADVKLAYDGTRDALFGGITWNTSQFHLHGQQVTELPPHSTPLASSAACRFQAFKVDLRTYAFQYHFEWNRRAIELISQNGLVAQVGRTASDIARQCDQHYDRYRHMGDRLCDNIVNLLFPIGKR